MALSSNLSRHLISTALGALVAAVFYAILLSTQGRLLFSKSTRRESATASSITGPILYLAGYETLAKGGLIPADRSRGYGEFLEDYLTLPIQNHAVSGATTRTFIEEDHWKRLKWHLRPNDIVLLQFGGSDEGDPNSSASDGHVHISDDVQSTVIARNKTVHTYQ